VKKKWIYWLIVGLYDYVVFLTPVLIDRNRRAFLVTFIRMHLVSSHPEALA